MKSVLQSTIQISIVLLLGGCSSSFYSPSTDPAPIRGAEISGPELPYDTTENAPLQKISPRLPWETWPLGRDSSGRDLRNRLMLEGDGYVRNGDRTTALDRYELVDRAALSPAEREALVLRVASLRIATGSGQRALSALTEYFTTSGRREQDVDAQFAILFAYAYARANDFEQSLAWFSRAYRDPGVVGGYGVAASQGVERLLRGLPDDALQRMVSVWAEDPFVRGLVAQESRRRLDGGTITAGALFPELSAGEPGTGVLSRHTVAVLLPLTGRYSKLGSNVQRGIEVALRSSPLRDQVALNFVDTTSEPGFSQEPIRNLLAASSVDLVIGPLLAEHAETAGAILRPTGIPLITLSRNARFSTGGSVMRLGPTAVSQVTSLLDVVVKTRGLTRIALVYPSDAGGVEIADAFRARLSQLGMQPVYESAYPRGDSNALLAMAQGVEDSKPQAVFFPDTLMSASRFFAGLTAEARASIVPLGISSWDEPGQLANSRAVMGGAIYVTPFFAAAERPEIHTFVEAFRATFGERPDFLAAQGFDVATIVLTALQDQSGRSLLDTVYGLPPYDGLTGIISLDPSGEFQRTFSVVQFQDGMLTELRGESSVDLSARAQPRRLIQDLDDAQQERYESGTGVTYGEEKAGII